MAPDLFPDSATLSPDAPEAERASWPTIPAKPAVYLLQDQDGQPLLLATVGDLRAALKRRLADAPPEARTKRIAYGQICSRILWRRVDSAFAANWWYWLAVRTLFPDRYYELIPFRQSWWIAVERAGPFPRLRATTDLSNPAFLYAGPIRERTAATKAIETLEDLFDLCRYHQELIQAPHGKPCAYKEMGKCPAPCDGSVPVTWYRQQMEKAWSFLCGDARESWREEVGGAMKSAATTLEFETANRLKQRLTRADMLDTAPFFHLAPLERFSYLTLQPGKGKPWLEPWFVHAGQAHCLPQVNYKDLAPAADSLAQQARELLDTVSQVSMTPDQSEQIAITAHHLFKGESDHGVWLRLERITSTGPQSILAAAENLRARKSLKPLVEQSSDKADSPEQVTEKKSESLQNAPEP